MDFVPGHQCTKAAIETALWDIMGKKLDLPVYSLIGGRYNDKLPVAGIINLGSTEQMVVEAKKLLDMGHKTIKIKGGMGMEDDVRNFAAVREAVGPNIKIRIDVEENYRPKTAIKFIRGIEPYDPELVSQPVSRFDLDGLSMVRNAVSTTILADECVFSPEDAMNVVKKNAADMINIKVMKTGGLRKSMKIAHIAELADMPCLVGSMLELGPGTSASAHFMTATRIAGSVACELCGPKKIKDDITRNPLRIENGFLSLSRESGLGFEIDDTKVERYRTRSS